jgi:hypothetical protein
MCLCVCVCVCVCVSGVLHSASETAACLCKSTLHECECISSVELGTRTLGVGNLEFPLYVTRTSSLVAPLPTIRRNCCPVGIDRYCSRSARLNVLIGVNFYLKCHPNAVPCRISSPGSRRLHEHVTQATTAPSALYRRALPHVAIHVRSCAIRE